LFFKFFFFWLKIIVWLIVWSTCPQKDTFDHLIYVSQYLAKDQIVSKQLPINTFLHYISFFRQKIDIKNTIEIGIFSIYIFIYIYN